MISEGFTEYMSLKLTEDLQDIAVYNKNLAEKFSSLKDFRPTPFAKVKSINDIKDRQTYVYDYAPILFIALEKEIGKKKMWQWIKTLLETKTEFTNYEFLTTTLKTTLKDPKKFQWIEKHYFSSENAAENAIKKISENKSS